MLDRGLRWYPADANCISLHSFSPLRTHLIQQRRHTPFPTTAKPSSPTINNRHPRMEDSIKQLEKQLKALTIEVTGLKEELRRQNNQNNQKSQQNPSILLRVGDRIRILNKVNRPSSWDPTQLWDYSAARKATVTSTTATRVYFTTDNGISTWRSYNHIHHE